MTQSQSLTVEQSRAVDRIAIEQFGFPSIVLMENAARSCAELLIGRLPRGDAVILCGRGNNGGDGYAIARHLHIAGWSALIIGSQDASEMSDDAATNQRIAVAMNIPVRSDPGQTVGRRSPSLILDAMLGTGARLPLRSPYDRWCRWANEQTARRIAIDVPTGMDAATGRCDPCVFVADQTLTFVAPKTGFANSDVFLGEVTVVPIGIPQQILREVRQA